MSRSRSKSVVQTIALEVVGYADGDFQSEFESKEARDIHNPILVPASKPTLRQVTTPNAQNRPRARSVSLQKQQAPALEQHPITPFTPAEIDALTQAFLDTLNYNSVLDFDHIQSINDHYDDDVLVFKANCDRNIDYLQALSLETDAISAKLASLGSHYDQVINETEDFARESTLFLQRQEHMETKAREIDQVMKMFEPLEKISKLLGSAGNNIIRLSKIMTVLAELQECLDFFETHTAYKDAELYRIRYRQCITRALTLLRNFTIDFLKQKTADATEKLRKGSLDSLALDIIMYSEFDSDLDKLPDEAKVSTLMAAISDKCESHSEYTGLLADILGHYFRLRLMLVQAHLQKSTLAPKQDADIVLYCQKSISTYKRILEKEFNLFCKISPFETSGPVAHQFFSQELTKFLKQILEPLYDDVRNKILRETSILELRHLTNLLATYYEHDEDAEQEYAGSARKLEYGKLFEPILNDSQARLIFRVQNFIDNKLLQHKPTPEDLQLGLRKDTAKRGSMSEEFDNNLFPELYMPVGVALTILSDLYSLVNSMVFDDLAHYVIHSCISMLRTGAYKLAYSHLGPIDAKLFYLKNLSILKSQLNNFDIQFVRTETSFDLTGGILELIQIFRAGKLYVTYNEDGGLLELVKRSAPKVINDMIDAKREIEFELSNAFNDFVTESSNMICRPILGTATEDPKKQIHDLNDNVLMKVPQIYNQIKSYIEEDEVIEYLFAVMSKLVMETYETYFKRVELKALQQAQAEDLNEIMEPDTFANFLSETIAGLRHMNDDSLRDFDFNESLLKVDTPVIGEAALESTPDLGPTDV